MSPTPEVLTVEAYQCEPGDVLFGTAGKVVIESVLFDGGTVGRWLLIDRMRRVITSKLTGQTFQIIRGGPSMDDAPGSGLLRPSLSLVPR